VDHLASVADSDRDGTISLDEYKKAFANGRQIQPVEACASISSVNSSEGFFQL
jgi:hypothetical protein